MEWRTSRDGIAEKQTSMGVGKLVPVCFRAAFGGCFKSVRRLVLGGGFRNLKGNSGTFF